MLIRWFVPNKLGINCKCFALISTKLNKVYLGTVEKEFKKRYYNHKTFKNRHHKNDSTVSIYNWEMLKLVYCKKSSPYSNVREKRMCPPEKF